MDINEIQKILPHRYPFLLVDRITELDEGKGAKGIKNVTINEPFFQGHFPGYPVMPGVLIVEAMAQVGATAILSKSEYQGKIVLFAGIDKVRIRQQVVPGDQLEIEVELLKMKASVGKAAGKVTVNGKLVCSGELMFAIHD